MTLRLTPPHIAVLLVHWNRPAETVACVRSLQATGHRGLSITVVDNASEPATVAELAAALPEVRLVRSPVNLGYAGGFNLAVRTVLAPGERRPDYLWLLNNDTLVETDCPLQLVAASERIGPAVLSPKILMADHPDTLWYAGGWADRWLRSHHVGKGEPDDGRYHHERRIPWGSGCSLFAPTWVAETIGPMCEDYFLYLEDVDWCLQAAAAGVPTHYVPQARIHHGVSKTVELLEDRVVWYYGWRNWYLLAFRHGTPLQRAYAASDLASRFVKTGVRLALQPAARHNAMYLARARALQDVAAGRWGQAPFPAGPDATPRPAVVTP